MTGGSVFPPVIEEACRPRTGCLFTITGSARWCPCGTAVDDDFGRLDIGCLIRGKEQQRVCWNGWAIRSSCNLAPKPDELLRAKRGDLFRGKVPPDASALHGSLSATVTMGCPMGSRQPSKSRESRAFRSPVRSCSPTGQLSVAYQNTRRFQSAASQSADLSPTSRWKCLGTRAALRRGRPHANRCSRYSAGAACPATARGSPNATHRPRPAGPSAARVHRRSD